MDPLALAVALSADDPGTALAALDTDEALVAARAVVVAMPRDYLCDALRLAALVVATERALAALAATRHPGLRWYRETPLARLRDALAARIRGATADPWTGTEEIEAEEAEHQDMLFREAEDPWEHAVY